MDIPLKEALNCGVDMLLVVLQHAYGPSLAVLFISKFQIAFDLFCNFTSLSHLSPSPPHLLVFDSVICHLSLFHLCSLLLLVLFLLSLSFNPPLTPPPFVVTVKLALCLFFTSSTASPPPLPPPSASPLYNRLCSSMWLWVIQWGVGFCCLSCLETHRKRMCGCA